ncbi:MAG: TraR/DksA C4-type zinc finger protein [Porphyrobacter sp.]|jgi:phage/conjugal plasmid C-4 type zinc finger TraR family protein|nr:TraR/DksA C4-type zinc finger protein [Porphyrobacter sp.]
MKGAPMDLGERGLERAETFERISNEAAIARIRNNLAGMGEEFCITCGERIDADRRAALPSARRCVDCQEQIEKQKASRR